MLIDEIDLILCDYEDSFPDNQMQMHDRNNCHHHVFVECIYIF